MKIQNRIFASLMLVCVYHTGIAQSQAKVKQQDFLSLSGNWKGTLTYLDYTTGKPYSMPADIAIKPLATRNAYNFYNSYPDEPKANSTDTLLITAKGRMIDGATVTARRKLKDGTTVIVTERMSKDGNDNLPALTRITYSIGKTRFSNIKEVQFVGKPEWIKRHEYSYTRN